MNQKILLIGEVATLLRVSVASVYRWLGDTRKGIGTFPLPISSRGGKLRWLESDVEAFLASQSAPPPISVPTARKAKRSAKAFQERQAAANKALQRHNTSNLNKERKISS